MTTLYRTVLIESAEQAEALPVGTIAQIRDEDGWHDVAVKVGRNDWRAAGSDSVMDWNDAYVVEWTALVPTEVEVEQIRESAGRRRTKTLYVTPWSLPTDPGDEAAALADCGDQE